MKALPVDRLHVLEDLLDMYHFKDEDVLVCEAFANAVDIFLEDKIKNPKIEITLEKADENTGYINFHNNGTPMTEAQFDKYHTIAAKVKIKGGGIGFAGVGAKVFLASKIGGEIFTITGENNKKFFASRMAREDNDVGYEEIKDISKIFGNSKYQHKYGTTYRVRLNSHGYKYLKERLQDIIKFWWNFALLKKQFTVTVDGKTVGPFNPSGERFRKSFFWKQHKINCYCWITEAEVPIERQHIVYSVHGKRIMREPISTPVNFKEDYFHRVFCLVDVSHLAVHIRTDKESFQGNRETNGTKHEVNKFFLKFLNENGLLGRDMAKPQTSEIVNEATKDLDKLLSTIEFKELDPFLTFRKRMFSQPDEAGDIPITETEGEGPVGGEESVEEPDGGSDVGHGEGKSSVEDKDGKEPGKRKERKSRGIRIIPTEEHPDEPLEGWVAPEQGAVVINILHPFYQTMNESDRFGKFGHFNMIRVLIEALIRHKSDELDWDAKKTLDKQNGLLHQMWRG